MEEKKETQKEKKVNKPMDRTTLLCYIGISICAFFILMPPISRMVWGKPVPKITTKEIVTVELSCFKSTIMDNMFMATKIDGIYEDGKPQKVNFNFSVSLRPNVEGIAKITDIEIPDYNRFKSVAETNNVVKFTETDTSYQFEFDYTKFDFTKLIELENHSAVVALQRTKYIQEGFQCQSNSSTRTVDL